MSDKPRRVRGVVLPQAPIPSWPGQEGAPEHGSTASQTSSAPPPRPAHTQLPVKPSERRDPFTSHLDAWLELMNRPDTHPRVALYASSFLDRYMAAGGPTDSADLEKVEAMIARIAQLRTE